MRHSRPIVHQEAHPSGRDEETRHPVLLKHPVNGFWTRVIQGALVGDGGAASQQRPVDDITVADQPADVRGGPPDIGRLQPKHPVSHAADYDLEGAVSVDCELRPGCCAGGWKDKGRLVGFQTFVHRVLPSTLRQEILPDHIPSSPQRHCAITRQNHHPLQRLAAASTAAVTRPASATLRPFR